MRIKLNEITLSRIARAIKLRIYNIPIKYQWFYSEFGKANKNSLLKYHNKYKGETCYLLANGPSLAKVDLSLLKNKYTVGMNRIYLLFEKYGFQTNFFVCMNPIVLEQFSEDINRLDSISFLNWISREHFDKNKKLFVKERLVLNDKFEYDITNEVYSGATVTYVTLQIIYYLGFTKVIILGLDHNFKEKGTPNKVEVRSQEKDESHFHPDYFPKGIKWQLPDLLRSEIAYANAKKAFENDNREIIDCTIDGKCNVFKKGKLEDNL